MQPPKKVIIEIIDPKELEYACQKVIDLLCKDLKLTPAQSYVVLKIALEEFPTEWIPREFKEMK